LGADCLAIAISKLSKPVTTKEARIDLLSQLDKEGVQNMETALPERSILGTKLLSMTGGY
jgi:hypothetical protein